MTTTRMRSRKAATTAVATPQPTRTALFDTSPASKQPFTWGRVPARDEALTIAGQPGALYSYVGAMECGRDWQYVLLVRYAERMDATAARVVVLAGWVLEEKEAGYGDDC